MDPLSDILNLLKPRNCSCAALDAGARWALRFPPYEGIKCFAVVTGRCWLAVEDAQIEIGEGDCVLLPKGAPFRIGGDRADDGGDAAAVFPPAQRGGVAVYNGGGDAFLIGSRFILEGDAAETLLRTLPPAVVIRRTDRGAALGPWLDHMQRELRAPAPGGALVMEHLAHLMLVEALRLSLQNEGAGQAGWLTALADRRTRTAIGHMHADPAHPWTVEELAARVGMSRTAFATTFKRLMGASPIDYLIRWRMLLAADRLTHTRDAIAEIAASLGYASESAFGATFKRVMGCAPRQYSRR